MAGSDGQATQSRDGGLRKLGQVVYSHRTGPPRGPQFWLPLRNHADQRRALKGIGYMRYKHFVGSIQAHASPVTDPGW